MATSETREGPGWWMAMDGGWNPPEMWPESTPPLPGWIRGFDGRWTAPSDKAAVAEPKQHQSVTTPDAPVIIDLRDHVTLPPESPNPTPLHAAPQHAATPEPFTLAKSSRGKRVDHQLPSERPAHEAPSLALGHGVAQPEIFIDQDQTVNRRRITYGLLATVIGLIGAGLLAAVLLL